MLAAKNENHAIGATFFFNIMHYALRPWPWILVALSSLIVFQILKVYETFPHIPTDKLGDDLAYSAMLTEATKWAIRTCFSFSNCRLYVYNFNTPKLGNIICC